MGRQEQHVTCATFAARREKRRGCARQMRCFYVLPARRAESRGGPSLLFFPLSPASSGGRFRPGPGHVRRTRLEQPAGRTRSARPEQHNMRAVRNIAKTRGPAPSAPARCIRPRPPALDPPGLDCAPTSRVSLSAASCSRPGLSELRTQSTSLFCRHPLCAPPARTSALRCPPAKPVHARPPPAPGVRARRPRRRPSTPRSQTPSPRRTSPCAPRMALWTSWTTNCLPCESLRSPSLPARRPARPTAPPRLPEASLLMMRLTAQGYQKTTSIRCCKTTTLKVRAGSLSFVLCFCC